jgi:hypothetical protein
MIARDLQRSATDFSVRQSLAQLGVRFVTETAITHWSDQGARCVSLLTGQDMNIIADNLIISTANRCDTLLLDTLRSNGVDVRPIGDAAGPRLAAAAIYDGRVCGLSV